MTVVLITGALTGIGRATALAFAHEGDQIVVSGRHGEAGEELAQELRNLGAEAEFICADVRHDEEMRDLIDQAVERFGRLDAAVNNAGTEGHPGPVTEQTQDSYAAVFDTNVLGTLLGLKHEMRVMAKQGGGSIVNLSSVLGKVGAPNAAVYTASKHAVEGLTKAAALEGAATGVRVNAVAPGPVETEMLNRFTGGGEGKENFLESVPVKRAATPQEIADTILFLACKAPFLTGQSIVVDGGKTAA
jgi:NAD(P)-dependent dehydrogenase (short-subunit alcohol dehydrogenase family)